MTEPAEKNRARFQAAFPLAQKSLGRQLQLLCKHESAVLASLDPEAIHQLRVTTRRIRANLRTVFAACLRESEVAGLISELGWLIGNSGSARDADVQIAALGDGSKQSRARSLRRFGNHLVEQRNTGKATLLEVLSGERYTCIKQQLAELVERDLPEAESPTVAEALGQILRQERRSIRRLCEHCTTRKRDQDLHRLRIRLKRLRYALEPFAPIYGEELQAFLAKLSKLQTRLGDFQDICVALEIMQCYSAKGKQPGKPWRRLRKQRQQKQRALRKQIRKQDLPRLRKLIRRKQLRKVFGRAEV